MTEGQKDGPPDGGSRLQYPHLFFKKAWAGGDNYSMVVKYSAGLKTLLQYGNSGPVFYGDLVLASSKV